MTVIRKSSCIRTLVALVGLVALAACGEEHLPSPDAGVNTTLDAAPIDDDAGADAGLDAGTIDARTCRAQIDPTPTFDTSALISNPSSSSFVPVIAARDDRVLVAWHQFSSTGTSAVHYVVIDQGCLGPERTPPEVAPAVQRPSVAVTPDGFVLAYHAQEPGGLAVRALWLDADGELISGPETISGSEGGSYVRVASNGANTAFAWFAGAGHAFALRGPGETVTATTTGVFLMSTVVLNAPRIALDSTGTLYLAYRDGGTSAAEWDALLLARPRGGRFALSANLSQSPGLLSDDLAVAIEPDDRLDVLWVEQDPIDVNSFEVEYSIVSSSGATPRARFGSQHQWSWMPAVAPGLKAVWHTGAAGFGPLFFTDGMMPAQPILPEINADGATIAVGASGNVHLAIGDHAMIRTIRYAWRR